MATWPSTAKLSDWRITIDAHSIGGAGRGGDYAFEKGAGARWVASVDVAPMVSNDAMTFRAFLHSLRGPTTAFAFALPGAVRATSPATAVVDTSAVAAGATSMIIGAISDAARVIAGEWVYVGTYPSGQLLQIVSVTGGTTLAFRPALRAGYSIGAAVTIGNVTAAFRLRGQTPRVPLIPGQSRTMKVELEEAY